MKQLIMITMFVMGLSSAMFAVKASAQPLASGNETAEYEVCVWPRTCSK